MSAAQRRIEEMTRGRILCCVVCGKTEATLYNLPTKVNPNLRACEGCIKKYGKADLADEADRQLEVDPVNSGYRPREARCFHCGEAVVLTDHNKQPMWCTRCEGEREELFK